LLTPPARATHSVYHNTGNGMGQFYKDKLFIGDHSKNCIAIGDLGEDNKLYNGKPSVRALAR
jgi:hypothetical protein